MRTTGSGVASGIGWPGPIAFVGAGRMGAPMARLLVAAGAPVTILARREQVRDEFAALGARTVATVAEAVADACLICTCLFDETQLDEVLLGAGGVVDVAPPGAVLVSHTTTGPAVLDRIDEAARARGLGFVDAPVSGSADEIEAGKLTVLTGGEAGALDLAEPVVSIYGTVVRMGRVGAASRAKLVNNFLFSANVQLVTAAVQLARTLGIDDDNMLAVLARCSGGSEVVRHMLIAGGSPEDFGARASRYLAKDVTAALGAAAQLSADPALLEYVVRNGPVDLLG